MEPNEIIGIVLLVVVLASPIYFVFSQLKLRRLAGEIKLLTSKHSKVQQDYTQAKEEYGQYYKDTEALRKYQVIADAELEARKVIDEAERKLVDAAVEHDRIVNEAEETAKSELKDSRQKAKALKDRAEQQLKEAHDIASKIIAEAKESAERIAGEAWEAKNNAEQYSETVKAMKNIIKGYGDEYLVPNESLLDDLADEYDHKEAGEQLKLIRTQVKSMIKNSEAADCDYAEPYRRTTAIEFVLDAFNGKVDSIMAKVKHDNYGILAQQLKDAFRLVNHNGKPFRNARINEAYFDLINQQLKSAVIVTELKRQDIEEQRQIREEMREEERARRDYEKAIKQAEKEERMLSKAMKEAEARLAGAAAEERSKFEEELSKLKAQLAEAEANGQRALSMAQQTKQGHVYIISNIGSFGENVFKIGMTRRLEPMDRVKELGDASVPFSFDVHALVHAKDAPNLERALHNRFSSHQVNKVNPRKEFFNLTLTEIKSAIEEMGFSVHWTMKAEALEYRESQQMARAKSVSDSAIAGAMMMST